MTRSIQPIVEGPGDVAAVPVLLRRLLHESMLRFDAVVMRPVNCTGKGNLRKRIQDSDCALELVREVCDSMSWFLASVSVVGGVNTGNPESTVNPKETLKQLLPRRNYRETEHQAKLTASLVD